MTSVIACAVCFGQSDAPMAVATNAGIWMMLGVVAVMLASFASFFIYLNRRARMLAAIESADPAAAGSHVGPHGFGSNPQEGTAQC
jgi:hypothetical protein